MKLVEQRLRLSATDLANFVGCRRLTFLDHELAYGRIDRPKLNNPTLRTLAERGDQHEAAYLEELKRQGKRVEKLERGSVEANRAQVLELMRAGVDVIAQAALVGDGWLGYADFLVRVELPREEGKPPQRSSFGAYAYEAQDTKLSHITKASAVLQLALYSDILEEMQGYRPQHMTVVSPGVGGKGFAPDKLRYEDYRAYYIAMRRRLEQAMASGIAETPPESVPKCESCDWLLECEDAMRKVDHISFVARSTRGQREELRDHGIERMARLAVEPIPLKWKPSKGSTESLERVREQARVQVEARDTKKPVWEFLSVEAKKGLGRLPEPSPGDIFFDFEGDPFVRGGGLEYLFGYSYYDDARRLQYQPAWALNHQDEKRVFEAFVKFLVERREKFPGMHVFHYAPYEPSAMRRLMLRHLTCVAEVDRLLREEVFVDLFSVVREGIRAGVESYSIKKLEPYFGFHRDLDLKDVGHAKRALEAALELADGAAPQIEDAWRDVVETYNRHDCESAFGLREWLEDLRKQRIAAGVELPRPVLKTQPPDAENPNKVERRQLRERLHQRAETMTAAADKQRIRLLAALVEFHDREEKVVYWEKFRLRDLQVDELIDEPQALSGLREIPSEEGDTKLTRRYAYPEQTLDLKGDEKVYRLDAEENEWDVGHVKDVDRENCIIVLHRAQKKLHLPLTDVYFHKVIRADPIPAALSAFARDVLDAPDREAGTFPAGRALLWRDAPTVHGAPLGKKAGESGLEQLMRVAPGLDGKVLPVQGPPGTGKTHSGAHVILELVRLGYKVGVTATAHKVIGNLVDKVVSEAGKLKRDVRCTQKVDETDESRVGVIEVESAGEIIEALKDGTPQVVAGTSWLWCDPDIRGLVDYLVIDEAGQFSLANALAVATATKNLILLGDPRQLEQPKRGAHPDGADASALEHLLGDKLTVPDDAGVFLSETWRLHPRIATLTSNLYYEGRLSPRRENSALAISCAPLLQTGIYYLPVDHTGNRNESLEEVSAVKRLVERLLSGGGTWTNRDAVTSSISSGDILIVSPYNAQVARLQDALPAMRIGTVDKFQGQEAAIVIISLAASSVADAPRGIDFLVSANRFNVATSRAKCACVLVASPSVLEAECRTPKQMKLANALYLYADMIEQQGFGRLDTT